MDLIEKMNLIMRDIIQKIPLHKKSRSLTDEELEKELIRIDKDFHRTYQEDIYGTRLL
jgi:hypothetical protein